MKNQNEDRSLYEVLENAEMKIEGDVIQTGDNFIQISNITRCWLGIIPKRKFPLLQNLIMLLLVAVLFIFRDISFVLNIGYLALICVVVYSIYRYVSEPIVHALNIELSSAKVYAFASNDQEKLKAAYRELIKILKDKKNRRSYQINFKTEDNSVNNTYVDGNLNVEKFEQAIDNSIHASDNSSVNTGDVKVQGENIGDVNISGKIEKNINITLADEELERIKAAYKKAYPENSEEIEKIEEAQDALKSENQELFLKLVKGLGKSALAIAENVAAGYILSLTGFGG